MSHITPTSLGVLELGTVKCRLLYKRCPHFKSTSQPGGIESSKMYMNLFTPLAVIVFAAVASTAEVPQDTISFTYPSPLVTTTVSEPLVTTTGTAPPVRTTAPPCGYEYDGMVMNAVLKA